MERGAVTTAPATELSVGVDTVRVGDVLTSIRTFGTRYLDRVYTEHEQASCTGGDDDRARALAGRFAAKEATYKALRSDDLEGPWTSIEIRRHPGGWCDITLHGAAARYAAQTGVRDLSVSLTHDQDLATAVVVAVRDQATQTTSGQAIPSSGSTHVR